MPAAVGCLHHALSLLSVSYAAGIYYYQVLRTDHMHKHRSYNHRRNSTTAIRGTLLLLQTTAAAAAVHFPQQTERAAVCSYCRRLPSHTA